MRGAANLLIFPDLDAATIAHERLSRPGGAQAIGPTLVGMAAPIHAPPRGSDVDDDIANPAVIAAADAQERARRRASTGS